MLGSKVIEVSYSNGEKYKECYQTSVDNNSVSSKRLNDGCVSRYYVSKNVSLDKLDENFPFFSVKKYNNNKRKVKYYHPSREIYKMVYGDSSERGKDLSCYDLSPDVLFWVGIGSYKNEHNSYDLIFSVDTDEQLRKVSGYYNLKFPLPKTESLDDETDNWHSLDFDVFCKKVNPSYNNKIRGTFKYGSVKFENNKPKLIKMYKSNYKEKV